MVKLPENKQKKTSETKKVIKDGWLYTGKEDDFQLFLKLSLHILLRQTKFLLILFCSND